MKRKGRGFPLEYSPGEILTAMIERPSGPETDFHLFTDAGK